MSEDTLGEMEELGSDDEGEESSSEELDEAAADVFSAVEKKDRKAFAAALRVYVRMAK